MNTTQEALDFLASHPEHLKMYNIWKTSIKDYRASAYRRKRHVAPHDENGMQRLISTGARCWLNRCALLLHCRVKYNSNTLCADVRTANKGWRHSYPGTLAPPLLASSADGYDHSMDVVFGTYWFYPAKPDVILSKDQDCIDDKKANEAVRFDSNSKSMLKCRKPHL